MRLGAGTMVLIVALLIEACASHPPAPPAPLAAPPSDASYDWHVLLVAPFGSLLKEIALPRSEVLLFDDPTQTAREECYTIDRPTPRFLDQLTAELTLCFRHDHLMRIEATVMLPAATALKILSEACALWQRNTIAADRETTPGACRGREGGIDFDGRLEPASDLEADRTFLPYTITLDALDPS